MPCRAEPGIALGERPHPALHVVGGVPGQPELGGPDRLHDVQDSVRYVAVDLLLVLVEENHVVAGGRVGEGTHPADHLLAVAAGAWSSRRKNENSRM